ncbi:MAG TPA: DUF484 family protein [Syntrophales bacterium]|nr:DUF484 family protein [Syntrophales bacterium]HQB31264.1 DUF484 family protein [Syntrophales bacterium]HQN79376.1 DUF484 family protein [Syntrophales bacterium]HQQ28216.1 DUF484 family protein [Syntrophales bacterium]
MTTLYRMEEIFHHVRANEEILRKFFAIEVEILTVTTLKDLFERLLTLVEREFSISHVWISLISEEAGRFPVEELKPSPLLKERLNLIPRKAFSSLAGREDMPKLVNRDLKPYYKLLPYRQKCMVKSMALCPLFFRDGIIGSLNLGDYSESRFQPEMDTFFLSQLSLILSIALSNVLAQEDLRKRVTRDRATGLLNHSEMADFLERQVSLARKRRFPLSVAVFFHENCDGSKESPDPAVSDARAARLAGEISRAMGKEDALFRSGENRYVLSLPYRDLPEAREFAGRVAGAVGDLLSDSKDSPSAFPVRVGVASTEEEGVVSGDTLVARAFSRVDDLPSDAGGAGEAPFPPGSPGVSEGGVR